MSFRFKITLLVTVLSLFLLLFTSFFFYKIGTESRQAVIDQLRYQISDHLNQAASIQAVERGVGNTIIGGNHDLLELFRKLGERGDKHVDMADAVAKKILTHGFLSTEFEERYSKWQTYQKYLYQQRSDVEAGVAKSTDWLDATSTNIELEFELRDSVFTPLSIPEAILYANTVLRPNIATLAEYAGRERAVLGNIIATGRAISQEENSMLIRYRSRVDLSTRQILLLKGSPLTPLELKETIETFESLFLGSLEELRNKVYSASRYSLETKTPPDYPVDSGLWIDMSTEAIDSALAVSELVGELALQKIEQRESSASVLIWLSSMLGIMVVFLMIIFSEISS